MPNYLGALMIERLNNNTELRLFIPAISLIKQRLDGIERLFPEFSFEALLTETLEAEDLSEEMLFSCLISLKLHFTDIVSASGDIWQIELMPFTEFLQKHKQVKIQACDDFTTKIQTFNQWLMMICNWYNHSLMQNTMIH